MSKGKEELACILFDLDGTLADSHDAVIEAYRDTFRALLGTYTPADDAEAQVFMTRRFVETVELLVPQEKRGEFATLYNACYERERSSRLRLFPHVREVLQTLKARGYRLGVVTNKERVRAVPDLAFLGLSDLLDVVITTEDTTNRKPHPEPILLALHRLGITGGKAMYVGDNPVDILAGHDAGTRTAAALWGIYPVASLRAEEPDVELHSMTDLLPLCPER